MVFDKKLFLDTKVFSSIGGGGVPLGPWGAPQALLWSLVNILCVDAISTHGVAVILHGMTSICRNVHDILHFNTNF